MAKLKQNREMKIERLVKPIDPGASLASSARGVQRQICRQKGVVTYKGCGN